MESEVFSTNENYRLKIREKRHCNIELPHGGRIECYSPFNSVQALFYDIHSPRIPDLYEMGYRKYTRERYLRVLICRNGSCEFTLKKYTDKLTAGHILYDYSIGDEGEFDFTSGYFTGVEIVLQLSSCKAESGILYKQFHQMIKSMKKKKKEIFYSNGYITDYSPSTEEYIDKFLKMGFDGMANIINIAFLLLLGYNLAVDFKDKSINMSDNQLIIAKDIYDSLTNEFSTKWTAQYFANK